MKTRGALFLFFIFMSYAGVLNAQVLTANAGADQGLCPGTTTNLSGSATGGKQPYTYHWEPAGLCGSPNTANTSANMTTNTAFTLTVIDADQDTAQDVVYIFFDDYNLMGAGPDVGRCFLFGNPVTIGDVDNHVGGTTFSWAPSTGLSSTTVPNPIASPTVTTTYSVTVSSAFCGSFVDSVVVNVYVVSPDAGPNVTIDEGQTITLSGSGSYSYIWTPNVAIMYANTANPDVNPTSSQTYNLQGLDEHGCSGYDSVKVFVRPGSDLYFYNTFTPNGDGNNDTWVISNIHKYPDNKLEIYNRYGQLIYKKNGYNNDWNGQYLGQELPSGTYFYMMDTNSDKGKFKGSLTIIR